MNDATTATKSATDHGPLTIKKYRNDDGVTIVIVNVGGDEVGSASWMVSRRTGGYRYAADAQGPSWMVAKRDAHAKMAAASNGTYATPIFSNDDQWSASSMSRVRGDASSMVQGLFANAVAWLETRLGQPLRWKSAKYEG